MKTESPEIPSKTDPQEIRVQRLIEGLLLDGVGLEVAPFYRPTILKSDRNVFYTDYATASELIKKHAHLSTAKEIAEKTVESDFIWNPRKQLIKCIPNKMKFDYAIASHVIEHVPNMIGWLSQIFEVLKVGGVVSLAVPDKRYSFDINRSETGLSELVDVWVRNQRIPSPGQIFDMLSQAISTSEGKNPGKGTASKELSRDFTDEQALEFAIMSHTREKYLDIHCSVFTPEGMARTLSKIQDLGLLNISISDPVEGDSEFFIRLTKLGEPRIKRPKLPSRLKKFIGHCKCSKKY